jgi:ectoine hydroxylase-related dioxygenase (phytanoyl-CoA dioxygenase family)
MYNAGMRTALTQSEIDQYRENGFLIIDGFLTSDELTNWQTCTEEAIRLRLAEGSLHNQYNSEDFYAQVFLQALKLADVHAGMRKIMTDPALGKMIAELAGVDGIRIWHDQALFKPPFGNATGWHLDNPYWSFSSRDSLSIWVALDDATLENGCLYYLPGTHKTARYDNTNIGQNQRDLFKLYPEWEQIASVATPCKAGAAVIHNGLTAHGAGANMTNRPRRAMTCAYMPDGSTFNGVRNILPEEYFDSLKVGDLLNDDVVNPLIYAKA